MNFNISITPGFLKSLKTLSKRYKSIKQDFAAFAESLKNDPTQGVELTPGIRKIRMAITSKQRGKSGGARIITYTAFISEHLGNIYLLDIYDKADYSTIDIDILQKKIKELGL